MKMSYNYHANQFETAFKPTRLKNWEVPKFAYPNRPQQQQTLNRQKSKTTTTALCNSNGHFLPNVRRPSNSPWGNFKSTWELPDRMSRKDAEKISNELVLNKPIRCVKKNSEEKQEKPTEEKIVSESEEKTDSEKLDSSYIPGKLTESKQQYKSEESQSELNDLYLEKHQCTDEIALLDREEKRRREKPSHVLGDKVEPIDLDEMRSSNKIPDKPNERNPSPLVPAYCNFQLARKMHQENLEHQPLPDCILDQAFRKLQSQRHSTPGLALDITPRASGIGIKTYAGPTQCTKLKIYRPKTCGILPKAINDSNLHRPRTSLPVQDKKMGSMDLAICWDYHPKNPIDEPKPPKHIDGSNGSVAPAVFTLVKSPRTPDEKTDTGGGRSGGIFKNTFGEPDFFDKDILRRQASFAQRSKSDLKCSCGTSPINCISTKNGIRSSTRESSNVEKCKSSPNLLQAAVENNKNLSSEKEIRNSQNNKIWCKQNRIHTCSKSNGSKNRSKFTETQSQQQCPRISTSKNKITHDGHSRETRISSDSGCSTMSTSSNGATKVLHIPKPRHPYAKKNYSISTLVPPFTCYKGGAGQGGYPEHWRLASVYQHAYKPIGQRKAPLLQTVYK